MTTTVMSGADGQQLVDHVGGLGDLLHIVEDREQVAVLELHEETLAITALVAGVEPFDDGCPHVVLGDDTGERHVKHAVGEELRARGG